MESSIDDTVAVVCEEDFDTNIDGKKEFLQCFCLIPMQPTTFWETRFRATIKTMELMYKKW